MQLERRERKKKRDSKKNKRKIESNLPKRCLK